MDLFNGDIEIFLGQKTLLVSQQINILLGQQLNNLSTLEQQIMYCLATHQQPVTINSLINKLPHISTSHIFQAIENLYSRCLIEKTADKYILPPLIMEYVQNNFYHHYPFINF
jgi:predicted transcriptional regulator